MAVLFPLQEKLVFFPDVRSGALVLDNTDRQEAYSMTLAVIGVVQLFQVIKRKKELHLEIVAFSISHDHRTRNNCVCLLDSMQKLARRKVAEDSHRFVLILPSVNLSRGYEWIASEPLYENPIFQRWINV